MTLIPYQCPLCSCELIKETQRFRCENNHQFDIAKEGYVNLVPANKKRSKVPGDSTEMMQARRRFLNHGHYDPLRAFVAKLAHEHVSPSSPITLLDIGCGEGYYTSYFQDSLAQFNSDISVFGLDISRVAVRYAAKRYPHCHFSVASSQHLPFLDHSLDAVIRIYAPCNPLELNRCVKDNGILITVTPAGRHLYQLRELIYEDVRFHAETAEIIEGFVLESEEKLSYLMSLSSEDSLDLLQMTPYAWKATEALKTHLANTSPFVCEADFKIRLYRKSAR